MPATHQERVKFISDLVIDEPSAAVSSFVKEAGKPAAAVIGNSVVSFVDNLNAQNQVRFSLSRHWYILTVRYF